MIINTQGIEVNDTQYIKKDGLFLMEVTKLEEDGYSQNGNPKFKLFFKGQEIVDKKLDPMVYSHTEFYSCDANMLWKIKQLEVALQAPEVYDINNFVGHFAIATIKMEEYNKKTNARVKAWKVSKKNKELPSIPEATQESSNGSVQSGSQSTIPKIDIDEDSIPF